MTTTDLATIDRVFAEAIEHEAEMPSVPEAFVKRAAQKTVIAGFEVHDKVAAAKIEDEGREQRRNQITAYLQGRTELMRKFAECGVTPLAYLPTRSWGILCQDAGLFVIDSRGRAPVDVNAGVDYVRQWCNSSTAPAEILRIAKVYVKERDHRALVRQAFTGPRRWAEAAIELPTPPAEVVEVLLKVRDLHPKTAAVPEAINFVGGLETVIANEIRRQHEAERVAREMARWDPIVYVEQGPATGIVAQFGDFPIEKEVLDHVLATEFLPYEDPRMLATTDVGLYADALGAISFRDQVQNDPFQALRMMQMQQQEQIRQQMMLQPNQGPGLLNGLSRWMT